MRSVELNGQRDRIHDLFNMIDPIEEAELKAHWARYLCVLISGFLENSVRTIYGDYSTASADVRSANYIKQKLKRFYNPHMNKLLGLCGEFADEWATALKSGTDGPRRAAIDSIVNNRNRIAHGEDVPITVAQVRAYFILALEVVEAIDAQCAV